MKRCVAPDHTDRKPYGSRPGTYCVKCHKAAMAKWYAKNREDIIKLRKIQKTNRIEREVAQMLAEV